MAFSIRTFFGKDKTAPEELQNPPKTAVETTPANAPMNTPTGNSPFQPAGGGGGNPSLPGGLLFKTAKGAEALGQPISSPFSPVAPQEQPAAGVTVGDILPQLPPEVVRSNQLQPNQPLQIPQELLESAVRNGTGALPLFEIYRVCPALFQTPISPQDPRVVVIPAARGVGGVSHHGQVPAAQGASPFGIGSAKAPEGVPFGSPTPPTATSPFTSAPAQPVAEQGMGTAPVSNPFAPAPAVTRSSSPFGTLPGPAAPPSASPFGVLIPSAPTGESPPALSQLPAAAAQGPFQVPGAQANSSPQPNPFASPSLNQEAKAAGTNGVPSSFAQPLAASFGVPTQAKSPEHGAPTFGQAPAVPPSQPLQGHMFGNPFETAPFAAAEATSGPTRAESEVTAQPFSFMQQAPAQLGHAPAAPSLPVTSPFGGASLPPAQDAAFTVNHAPPSAPVENGASPFGAPPSFAGWTPQAPPPLQSAPHSPDTGLTHGAASNGAAQPFSAPPAPASAAPSYLGPQQSVGTPFETAPGAPVSSAGGTPFGTAITPAVKPFPQPPAAQLPQNPVAEPAPSAPNPFERIQALQKANSASAVSGSSTSQAAETPAPLFTPKAELPAGALPPTMAAPTSVVPFGIAPDKPLFTEAAPKSTPLPPPRDPSVSPAFGGLAAGPPAPPTSLESVTSSEKVQLSLATVLKNCTATELGIDPQIIPSWVQVSLPTAALKATAPGAPVTLPLGQVIAGLDPEFRNLVRMASPDLRVTLPPADGSEAPARDPSTWNGETPKPVASPISTPAPLPTAPPASESFDPFSALPPVPQWSSTAATPVLDPFAPLETRSFEGFKEPATPLSKLEPSPEEPPTFENDLTHKPAAIKVEPEQAAPWAFKKDPDITQLPAPLFTPKADPLLEARDVTEFSPVAASPISTPPVVPVSAPAVITHTLKSSHGRHQQMLLRALLGIQGEVSLEMVLDHLAHQPGALAAVCVRKGTVIAKAGNGSAEAARFLQQASGVNDHLAAVVALTGIDESETFSIRSEQSAATFSLQNDLVLGVLQDAEIQETALLEKITLIARELPALIP